MSCIWACAVDWHVETGPRPHCFPTLAPRFLHVLQFLYAFLGFHPETLCCSQNWVAYFIYEDYTAACEHMEQKKKKKENLRVNWQTWEEKQEVRRVKLTRLDVRLPILSLLCRQMSPVRGRGMNFDLDSFAPERSISIGRAGGVTRFRFLKSLRVQLPSKHRHMDTHGPYRLCNWLSQQSVARRKRRGQLQG